PGASATYGATAASPTQSTAAEPSPGSNRNTVGVAVTSAHTTTGPSTDADTDFGVHDAGSVRKSSGTCTYAQPNSRSNGANTGTGWGSVFSSNMERNWAARSAPVTCGTHTHDTAPPHVR